LIDETKKIEKQTQLTKWDYYRQATALMKREKQRVEKEQKMLRGWVYAIKIYKAFCKHKETLTRIKKERSLKRLELFTKSFIGINWH